MEIQTPPRFPAERDMRCPMAPPAGHRELAPIQKGEIWDGTRPWLVSSNALYRELINDPRISNDVRRDGYPSMTAAFKELRTKGGLNTFDRRDGEEHAGTRRIVIREFSAKRMAAMKPEIQAYLDGLFDRVLAGPQPLDLVSRLALPFTSRVVLNLLGIPYEDYDYFVDIVRNIVSTSVTPEEAARAHVAMRDYVDKLIDITKDKPNDGVVSHLVAGQLLTGAMTRSEIIDITLLLLIGGWDTSANSMALGTVSLLLNPEQYADLVANVDDPSLVSSTVEELVRYVSITHNGRRRVATDDIVVGDVTIEAGDGVIFLDDMANRDPEAFDGDPDVLDIRRNNARHVAYAFGPHTCLGNQLARLELKIFFQTLARRMPNLHLAVDASEIEFLPHASIYGVKELPIAW